MSLGTLLTIFVVPTMYTLLARRHAPGAKKELALPEHTPGGAALPHRDLVVE
jgi:multidrug efflux pump